MEAIISIAVFGVIASASLLLVTGPLAGATSSLDRQRALFLAEEGIEATRAIRDCSWAFLDVGDHGLALTPSGWEFNGTSDESSDGFTRVVSLAAVNRDAGGDIVLTGGTEDSRTRKVTATVSWDDFGTTQSVGTVAYLSDWDTYDWKHTTDTDFLAGEFTNTRVVNTGVDSSVELDPQEAKVWLPQEGILITETADTDWTGGTFTDTEIVGTGVAASLNPTGPFRWLTLRAGESFTHTTDADFLPGTFSDTVVVDTGDLGAVALDTYEIPAPAAGWVSMASGTGNDLNDIAMVSATEGWAVGGSGTILAWDGNNWSAVSSPVGNTLRGVYAVSSTDAWAVGDSGKILRWDGVSWTQHQDTGNHKWYAVECPASNDCWISTTSGRFWHWTGSGNFSQTDDTGRQTWYGLSCVSTTDCWAAGNGGRIAQWDGASWSQVQDTGRQTWYGVDMVGAADGWMVGSGGSIRRWNGATWGAVTSPTGSTLNGVSLSSASIGWAVGDGGTVIGWDGVSWTTATSPTTENLNGVDAVSDTAAYAAGDGGAIIEYQAGGGSPTTAFFSSGTFLSGTYDAGHSADWTRAFWSETLPANTDLTIAFRTGATATPDVTWSAWSAEFTDSTEALIPSPDNQYLQYRATLSTTDDSVSPRLESIVVYYDEPASLNYNDVRIMVANADGWLVGDGGSIARLSGTDWVDYPGSPTTDDLYGVDFAADDDVWAVGAGGRIIHWDGVAWASVASPTTRDLYDVDILPDGTGWAVGHHGTVIELLANGQWSSYSSPTNKALNGVSLTSATDGWAVGNNGTVLRWDGATWAAATFAAHAKLNAISAVSATFAVTVANGGEAYIWDGLVWAASTTGTPNSLSDVSCVTDIYCWAVGVQQTFIQWDGLVWSEYVFDNPTNPLVLGIHIPPTGDGYAVGESGAIYRYTAEYQPAAYFESNVLDSASTARVWNTISWDSSEPLFTDLTLAVRTGETAVPDVTWSPWSSEYSDLGGTTITAPAGRYLQYRTTFTTTDESVAAVLQEVRLVHGAVTAQVLNDTDGTAVNDVWAVGRAGTAVRYDGASWDLIPTPTSFTLNGISALSASVAWAVGRQGVILEWDGVAWVEYSPSPTTSDLQAVFALAPDDVWAVGDAGTVIHYDGVSWSAVSSPTGNDLYGVHLLSATQGFAVGEAGTIIEWDGVAWSNNASPTGNRLNAVFVVGTALAWAVGDLGTIIEWDGAAWSAVASPVVAELNAIEARTGVEAWAVGDFGTIVEYDGLAWNSFTSPTTRDLYGITVYAPTDGWACGALGILLKDPVTYYPSGTFLSSVLDTDAAANFQAAFWQAEYPAGTDVTVALRSGPGPTPDGSWAAWSSELLDESGDTDPVTGDRYWQYRLTLSTSVPEATPSLEEITVTYMLQ